MDVKVLVERLEKLDAAVVADTMSAKGLTGQVAASDLCPLDPNWKLVGPAICAKGSEESGDNAKPAFGLDDSIYCGGVVVIDTDDCDKGAVIGDNMATSMMKRGAKGFVVDGGIRDRQDFIDMDLPMFCRYCTPINAHKYWSFTEFEQPVKLRGIWDDVNVNPGDLIIADSDGVAVIPRQHALQILADAELHQETENSIKAALEEGEDREEVSARLPRLQHVKPLCSD